jgi:hypothetical protein
MTTDTRARRQQSRLFLYFWTFALVVGVMMGLVNCSSVGAPAESASRVVVEGLEGGAPGVVLSGTVRHGDGTAAIGIGVGPILIEGSTDSYSYFAFDGTFAVVVPQGTYTTTVDIGPGCISVSEVVTVTSSVTHDLTLPTFPFAGHVLTQSSSPLAGVVVNGFGPISLSQGDSCFWSDFFPATSGADGSFTAHVLQAGTYYLRLSPPLGQLYAQTYISEGQLITGTSTSPNLTILSGFAVTGTVRHGDGTAMTQAGATVSFQGPPTTAIRQTTVPSRPSCHPGPIRQLVTPVLARSPATS